MLILDLLQLFGLANYSMININVVLCDVYWNGVELKILVMIMMSKTYKLW